MATKKPTASDAPKPSIADKVRMVCEMVVEGQTVRQIADHFGVSPGTVLYWIESKPEYAEQYARARASAADMFENDIIEAAQAVTPETAAADRVKIDALKWVAARRAPKRYGDKLQQEVTGPDGGPVQQVVLTAADYKAARAEMLGKDDV